MRGSCVPVKFIAEASSNHGQDLSRALAFVDAAADCGCDAVKFQLFRIAELFAPEILAEEREASRAREMGASRCPSGAARRTRAQAQHRIFLHALLSRGRQRARAVRRVLQDRVLRASLARAARSLRGHRQARDHLDRHGDDARDQGCGRHAQARALHATSPRSIASPPIRRRPRKPIFPRSPRSAMRHRFRPAGPTTRVRPR